MSVHTLQQQIDSVAREIKMREYVYPVRVATKKMKQDKADYELGAMRAVLATLVGLQATTSRDNAALVSAAKELLRLKDLHDAIEREELAEPIAARMDYDENKPLAWAALRAAIVP